MRVLLSAPYMLPVQHRFAPLFEEYNLDLMVPVVEERLSEQELLEHVGDIDGAICGDDAYTASVFDAAPRLRVVSKWGTGVDSIDATAAQSRGIVVCRTPGAFTDPVADSVLGYMLAFARSIPWADRAVKAGDWTKRPGIALHECVLGIIGIGDIGRAVARRANAFGMQILGCDIRDIPEAVLSEHQINMVDLHELLELSDFVTLNCDLNPTSRHLIGTSELRRMKPTAYLVNTARGAVINESALGRALQDREIQGAALDVYEVEPLPHDSVLRECDQCLLAPHNANSSPGAWEHVHRNTIQNLLDVLRPGTHVHWDQFPAELPAG